MKKFFCLLIVMMVFLIPTLTSNVYAADYEEVCIVWTSTDFNGYVKGRTTNIQLAAAAINGKVLQNGEQFSFNGTVGKRTVEKGYQQADVFVNTGSGTKVVKGIGGGICQVSSTIHKAARATKMQIVERHLHSKPVSYCSREDEATVSWGTLDFKFINTSGDPLRIEMKILKNTNGVPYRLVCAFWQRVSK